MKKYIDAKLELKDEIDENEGTDIIEQMKKERQQWVDDEKAMTGKLPADIKPFYDRNNVETPLSPEEEAAKAAEDDDGGKGKGKKKPAEKKEKGKKKKKGAKGDDDGAGGTTKLVYSEVM
jgi:hypothetical protein